MPTGSNRAAVINCVGLGGCATFIFLGAMVHNNYLSALLLCVALYATALQAEVTNSTGNPMSGIPVTFAAPSSGASATLSSASAITNSLGIASVTATANTAPGNYTIVASAGTLAAGFSLTNAPAALMVTPAAESTLISTAFPTPIQVTVRDTHGATLAGATVNFSVPSTGASAVLSSATAVTNSSGTASITATANAIPGKYSLVIAVPSQSLSGSVALTNQFAPGMTLSASPGTSVFGAPVTLTLTVSPASATGLVTFYDGVTLLGTKPLSSGMASLSTILLPAGIRKLKAYYAGDGVDLPGTSNIVTQTVNAVAGPSLLSLPSMTIGTQPYSVTVADFNGDGKADLVVVNSLDGTVGVLMGKGDGTFKPQVTYPATGAWWVGVADFNGDGKPDLAVANGSGSGFNLSNVAILLGNGDGTFQPEIASSIPGYAQQFLAIGDFNGDGKADIVVSNCCNENYVSVLIGNGDGTFQPPVNYPTGSDPWSIALGDFNGDGKTDLAVANYYGGTVSILMGNGDGTFQPKVDYAVGAGPVSVTAGDFNGSGQQSLAVGTQSGVINILLNSGSGTFEVLAGFPAGTTSVEGVTSGDFNGDGVLDLAVAGADGSVAVLRGNGNGAFQPAVAYTVGCNAHSVAVGEFNGDGKADLAVVGNCTSSAQLPVNNYLTIFLGAPSALGIAVTDSGNFKMEQSGTYTVTVSNQAGAAPTSGTVTVTEKLPTGLSGAYMSGDGWTCTSSYPTYACTRSDMLSGGASYPAITVTVSVLPGAPSPQINSVTVSGGGSAPATATDYTPIGYFTCTYSISPASATVGVAGGTGTVTVTTSALCAWSASTTQSWISVASTPGFENGTVTFTVAANSGAPRTGWLTIGGQTFTVSQSAGYLISTIAGGIPVPATAAAGASTALDQPWGVAADAAGNVYFSSGGQSSVYKLDTNGIVTRVAGNGVRGYGGDGGPATAATISDPTGVAVDNSGNLFIADRDNARVRMVAPNGIITTVAGTGGVGFAGDGGPATSATFSDLAGLAVDNAGNLYIADGAGFRIRRVAPNGIITTVAGTGTAGYSGDNGPAISAQLDFPFGIAVDGSGNLYIADSQNHRIRKVSVGGTITTVAGEGNSGFSGDNGPAAAAQLNYPTGVATDSAGNLYIADRFNSRIRMVSAATAVISTVAGSGSSSFSGDNGPANLAGIWDPSGLAVTSSGNLYLIDSRSDRIRKVSGGIINTVAGGANGDRGAAPLAQFNRLNSVARDNSGNLYIVDLLASRVRKVTPSGTITTEAGGPAWGYSGDNGPATSATLKWPSAVVADGAGNLYISDTGNNAVRKVTASSGIITTVASGLNAPWGVALDTAGNLYVADASARVFRVGAGGSLTVIAGTGTAGYSGDGAAATAAQLGQMIPGLAADTLGNLYITDTYNSVVRKVDSHGVITTVVGSHGPGNSGDGVPATSAQLSTPVALTIDSSGNLFVGDSSRVRQITSSGIISTVAGNGYCCIYAGDGGSALLASGGTPYGLALDSAGNIYLGDIDNGAVRLLTPIGTQPVLMVASAHTGTFVPGGTGVYTLTVTNAASAGPTSGTVTLTDILPSWLTVASIGGTGWGCSGTTCTRSDVLSGGSSYPALAVTVNVAANAPSQVTNQATVIGGGAPMTGAQDFTLVSAPILSIAITHTGNFTQGQANATYTVTVSNQAWAGPTSGTVTVTENVPSGLTVVSMGGSAWACSTANSTCTRNDPLDAGSSYSPITVTVAVSPGAASPQVNSVTVSGGGSASATATDSAVIGAGSCTYSISPASATFAAAGGTGSVSVTAPAGCWWTASTTQTWLSLTSGATGTGNGTAAFSVAANAGAPRTGSLAIAGQTIAASQSASYLISTIAGKPTPATAAPGTSVAIDGNYNLEYPFPGEGVVADNAGDVYFSSYSLNSVLKLDTHGILARMAGPGVGAIFGDNGPSYNFGDNGPAVIANVQNPGGMALDSSGSLYFADTDNGRIRKVSAGGIITTLAGTGTGIADNGGYSGDNGPATSAQLFSPVGVALDGSGNLYIADTGNNRIRKVDTNGVITTVAGSGGYGPGNSGGYSGDNGPATSAELSSPTSLVVDTAGNLYIADGGNSVIRKVSTGGTITTIAGTGVTGYSGDGGPAVNAKLCAPTGVALDSAGNLYIADWCNSRIRKIDAATGIITTVAGSASYGFSGDNGSPTSAQLNYPTGVAVTASGDLYINDIGNVRIRKVSGGVITTVAGGGNGDGGPAPLAGFAPIGVARDNAGNLYIADAARYTIRRVAPNGTVATVAGNGTSGYSGDNGPAVSAQLSGPSDVKSDGSGNLYIVDSVNNVIRKVTASTGVITTVAISGGKYYLKAESLDGAGNLYVADTSGLVRKMDTAGTISIVAGTGVPGYSGDGGPATAAQLSLDHRRIGSGHIWEPLHRR